MAVGLYSHTLQQYTPVPDILLAEGLPLTLPEFSSLFVNRAIHVGTIVSAKNKTKLKNKNHKLARSSYIFQKQFTRAL